MSTKVVNLWWEHVRISLALDPTKYIHMLLPTTCEDPETWEPIKRHHEITGAGVEILLTDWISHTPCAPDGNCTVLRGCNIIVDDGARTVADLITMVRSYCDRYNNSENRVVLASDAELHDWVGYSNGRCVWVYLPDVEKPLSERGLLLKEVLTIHTPDTDGAENGD